MLGLTASAQAWARTKALGKGPWRARLHAWWEGYEWIEPGAEAEPEGEGEPDWHLGGGQADEAQSRPAFEEHSVAEGWPAERIKLNDMLWGEGFASPGGADVIAEMVAPLGLTEENSVVDLGCGLGGSTRAIANARKSWVAGYEEDPALAAAAMEKTTMAGMTKKAPVQASDLGAVKIRRRTIDCVFSKEALFTVGDKKRLFKTIQGMLKLEGHLLFTDYIAALGAPGPATEVWAAHEPKRPRLWSIDETSAALEELGFEVRITEDITDTYRERVVAGFGTLLTGIQEATLAPELASWGAAEAEHWARRIAVLDSGEVKVYRVYARVPIPQ